MISIVIPTYNNLDYLKLCLNSIKRNSFKDYEVLLHINDGSDGSLKYAIDNNIKHTFSKENIGLCSSINTVCKKIVNKYILYSHDDMYFCPNWDIYLLDELKKINDNKFYLSGTMIEPNPGAHIRFDCGQTANTFDEKKLLDNYKKLPFYDHQGSHFPPLLIERKMWEIVGGFSEEFNPGMCSDPDFNMKLWNQGVRIFKGINNFRVYHFSSLTTRKKNNLAMNRGDITFLKKWGFTHKFFKKHYLKSNTKFLGPLKDPKKNLLFYFDFLLCKIKLIYSNFFF